MRENKLLVERPPASLATKNIKFISIGIELPSYNFIERVILGETGRRQWEIQFRTSHVPRTFDPAPALDTGLPWSPCLTACNPMNP
jgi:hypothetical protein